MNLPTLRTIAFALAIATGAACSSQDASSDQRLAEIEKQLADTQKQLADAKAQSSATEPPASAPGERPAATAAAPAAAPGPSASPSSTRRTTAAVAPPRPTSPPESQKYLTTDQAAKEKAELQRLAEQQKAVNAGQAETNARLQRQVEQLKPREVTLPAGTVIPVRTTAELSTAKLSNGSAFDALLERDLSSGDTVLARAGTRVGGFVVSSDPGGRVEGVASLTVGVRSIVGVNGTVIAVTTDSYSTDAASTRKKDAVRTGIATGVGAIIGGIAGGGSGAAIGAGAGAAAGVGTNVATRGAAAIIPSEELMEFRLVSPVTVLVQPADASR